MDEELLTAAEQGDGPTVTTLLKAGANPNALRLLDRETLDFPHLAEVLELLEWTTPIALAARNGHLDAVRTLWEHGADINGIGRELRDDDHLTESYEPPIVCAVQGRHIAIVRFLQEHGATIVRNCLEAAVQSGEEQLIDLVRSWMEPRLALSILQLTARNADNATLRLLLNRGIEVNAAYSEGYPDWNGNSLLMYAVKKGDRERVRLLLEYGADVRYTNPSGFSALDVALYEAGERWKPESAFEKATYLSLADSLRAAGAPESDRYIYQHHTFRKPGR